MKSLCALAGILFSLTMPAHAGQLFAFSEGNPQKLEINGSIVISTTLSSNWQGYSQGWWSPSSTASDWNDNYTVGFDAGAQAGPFNNFFTFLIPRELQTVTSAKLILQRFGSAGLPVTYSVYDVTTDYLTLNQNSGTSQAIYDDLGSGVLYGSVLVTDFLSPDPLEIPLNAQALAAIQASIGGYFSIGGTLKEVNAEIPEPGTFALFSLGAAALLRRRFRC